MNQNSIDAWKEVVEPTLPERQRDVFEVIKKHPGGITGYEVAMILERFPNQISGRFGELVGKGLIILSGEFKHIGNSRTRHGIWILTEKGKQFKL